MTGICKNDRSETAEAFDFTDYANAVRQIPASEPERSETALIAFTTLLPAAIGLSLFAFALEAANGIGFDLFTTQDFMGGSPVVSCDAMGQDIAYRLIASGAAPVALALLLTIAGMAASLAHLASIIRAPYSLINIKRSWLSREIAFVSAFAALLLAWIMIIVLQTHSSPSSPIEPATGRIAVGLMASFDGIALLFVIARAYRIPSRPEWNGIECALELSGAALGSGSALMLACAAVVTNFLDGLIPASGFAALCAITLIAQLADLAFSSAAQSARVRRLEAQAIENPSIKRILDRVQMLEKRLSTARRRLAACVALAVVLSAGAIAYATCAPNFPEAAPTALVAGTAILACLNLVSHAGYRSCFYLMPCPVRFASRIKR